VIPFNKPVTLCKNFLTKPDFYPTNLNHAFMPKQDFEGYRQEAKKQYEGDEISPNLLSDDLHKMPDNPSTFMTRIR
jgi:hypothetical protein